MTKKAPTSDNRNMLVAVYDTAGEKHEMTLTNAREMMRHSHWTMDKDEAAKRRGSPVIAPAKVNDGQPQPQVTAPQAPALPVWEDITVLPKPELRRASIFLKIGDIDGRSSEKRIAAAIDTALDQRLSASGDFEGSDPVAEGATDEEKQAHEHAVIARRKRAFGNAAVAAGLPIKEDATISSLIGAFAAQVENPQE